MGKSENTGFSAAGHFGDDKTQLSVMLSSQEMDYRVPHEHDHGDKGA